MRAPRLQSILPIFRPVALLVFAAGGIFLGGCVIVTSDASGSRNIFVVGVARVRVPSLDPTQGAPPQAVQVTGVGIAITDAFRLGYFDEFKVTLRPDSNSAVIIVRNEAERRHLEALLKNLNSQGTWILTRK